MHSGTSDRRGTAIADLTLLFTGLLVLVGIELTTRAFSAAFVRFREGVVELVSTGETTQVPTLQFWTGSVLLGVAILAGALRLARIFAVRTLPDLRCPECGEDTKRIRRRTLHRIAAPLLGMNVSRRSCSDCGWVGLAKDI